MMQICGAGPYDQHIMLGEHELTDHSQSLAALGIFPGSLLTLKVSFAAHRAPNASLNSSSLRMTEA